MVSAISTTNRYILQPNLVEMHRKSLECLSEIALWKRELHFFNKLLDKYGYNFCSLEDKEKPEYFQNLITYSGALADQLNNKIRQHENNLARMLQEKNESDIQYFNEHHDLIAQVEAFSKSFSEFRHDLYNFIEKAI